MSIMCPPQPMYSYLGGNQHFFSISVSEAVLILIKPLIFKIELYQMYVQKMCRTEVNQWNGLPLVNLWISIDLNCW